MVINWLLMITKLGRQAAAQWGRVTRRRDSRLQMMVGRCLNGKMEAGSGAGGGGGVGAELSSVSRVPRRGYISPPGVTRRSSIPTHTQ